MFLGLIFAIAACFVWGLIFIIPGMLGDHSPLEIVIGRYGSYGLLSFFLFFRKGLKGFTHYPLKIWVMAFVFALASNIFYYIGIVAGLRYASPPITVLVLGMAPIVIAFYGNWHSKEVSFRSLSIPCIWIGFGMILINAAEVDWTFQSSSMTHYLLGMLGVIFALTSWSWYAVHNAKFLKGNTHVSPNEWATIIGVATLFWTILLGIIFGTGAHKQIDFAKIFQLSHSSMRYFGGSLVLGVICSWMGCFLWNRASSYLPVSLMGPILIFETIFGLIFVFLYEFRLPTLIEILGVTSMLSGILSTVIIFKRRQTIKDKLIKN